jgi:nucleoside-diphosphate-sugar epimerase
MKKKVLVLGGTRYFGRHLIEDLLLKGYDVTIATRGNLTTPFSRPVNFVTADRKKLEDLKRLAESGPFDIIFDQVCMTGLDSENAVTAFSGNCKRYIFTSTGSVYDFTNDHVLIESDFDPKNYIENPKNPNSYQEDKRKAEAVFSLQSNFPVAMVRFPIVLGMDDYTERLKFHVKKILNNEEIYIPRLKTIMSFISSDEAGRFLSFLGDHHLTGPVNAASTDATTLSALIQQIENATGKIAKITNIETSLNGSPFGSEFDFNLGNAKASSLGFKFAKLNDYLPKLIETYRNNES